MPDRGTRPTTAARPAGGSDPQAGPGTTAPDPREPSPDVPSRRPGPGATRRPVEPALGLEDFLREIGVARG